LIPPTYVARARIFKQSMGARNRVGIGLSYQSARLHRLAVFIPEFLKRFQIRSQLASGIRSLESIPGLLKHLQIQAQATLASGIGSLESIPGLLKHLQILAQATLASRIGSLESIPWLHNMKNEDKDNFFGSKRRKMNIFVPQLMKEQRKTNYSFLYYQRTEDNQSICSSTIKGTKTKRCICSSTIQERRRSKVFAPQLSKERRRSEVFVPQLSKEKRRSEVFVP
jgi:hypothetical protein